MSAVPLAMFCESKCPEESTHRQIVMNCQGMRIEGAGAECRWPDGSSAPAVYDAEASSFSCSVPVDAPVDASPLLLHSKDGTAICNDMVCSVRRRCVAAPRASSSSFSISSAAGNNHDIEPEFTHQTSGAQPPTAPSFLSVFKQLSWTDRLLSAWIIAAMILGVILGKFTNIEDKLQTVEVATVSLPIAIGLWMMMWPVLTKVQYEVLGRLLREQGMWKQVSLSLVLNWLVGPALMMGLAWATLPDLPHYRNGVILVGLARCIAMVLLWNQLARGHAEYCAVLVAINSVMQMILYAPMAIFYIKVVSRQTGDFGIGFWSVARSVLVFLGAPLVAGIILRYGLIALKGKKWLDEKFMPYFGPLALVALVYTIIILFALQAENVLGNIGSVFRVAVPMALYFSIMWVGTLLVARKLHSTYEQTVTQCFTASSNNFELAIAIAVGAFGVNSKEALAATIGPLIEVPVLLALVYVALWLRQKLTWSQAPTAASQ